MPLLAAVAWFLTGAFSYGLVGAIKRHDKALEAPANDGTSYTIHIDYNGNKLAVCKEEK